MKDAIKVGDLCTIWLSGAHQLCLVVGPKLEAPGRGVTAWKLRIFHPDWEAVDAWDYESALTKVA